MSSYNTISDDELTRLLKSGDAMAFKELYDRYWDILLDTAFKRLDSIDAAEEVVQELFVSLFLKREGLNIKTSLEAYLKTALKYKIFDLFRSKQVHNKYIDVLVRENKVVDFTPDHALQLKELSKKIDSATDKMPEKCKEVFLLSRVEKLSNKSIAEKLKISVSTVEKHISKAKKILETDLKEYHLEAALILFYFFKK